MATSERKGAVVLDDEYRKLERRQDMGRRGGILIRTRYGLNHFSKAGKRGSAVTIEKHPDHMERMRRTSARVTYLRTLYRRRIERGEMTIDDADRRLLRDYNVLFRPTRSKRLKALRRQQLGLPAEQPLE